MSYSDGTPAVTYTYDRLGRQKTITSAGMNITRHYNNLGKLLAESYSGGLLNGITVTNIYDQYLRRTNLVVKVGANAVYSTTYAYDNAGRLQCVSNAGHSATYSYLASSPLVEAITFKQGTQTRMTTTKRYDYLNRLLSITSVPTGSGPIGFTYTYNNAERDEERDLTKHGSGLVEGN